MTEKEQAMLKALAEHCGTGHALLIAYMAAITPERMATLTENQARGWRVGIALNPPADRVVGQVLLLDPATGEQQVFGSIAGSAF